MTPWPIALPWPFALVEFVASLCRILEAESSERPARIEITFGPHVLEDLRDAGLFRQLVSVTLFLGAEVKFPERPGDRLGVIEVQVTGATQARAAGIDSMLVLASASEPEGQPRWRGAASTATARGVM